MADQYILIPGTNKKVFEGTVVVLNRLPNLKWILHTGPYTYAGRRQKGWYFSSIPSDTVMPVFNEDLTNMTILDSPYPPVPGPGPGPGPIPPFPPGPIPPAPIPIPFTPQDKKQLNSAMLTVDTIAERDKLGWEGLQDGKIVRVNDTDGEGKIEYYEWNSALSQWKEASLGYRYMTRDEINQAIGSDIVDITWSNQDGALVITNNNSETLNRVLEGVAHDASYLPEELKIRIPIYGKQDLEIVIPKDTSITGVRFESKWTFPDGSVKPAIVITVTDGTTTQDIAGDASDIYAIYEGAETASAIVLVDSETSKITAQVKLSSIINNAIEIDNEGLLVDLSGYLKGVPLDSSVLLVADGNGSFTQAGNGIEVETSTAIADLTNPEKKVVTANLIADAIQAAVSAVILDVDNRLEALESAVSDIEARIDFGQGIDGDVLMTNGDGVVRSGVTVGGSTLSGDSDVLATEEAVTNAMSWTID